MATRAVDNALLHVDKESAASEMLTQADGCKSVVLLENGLTVASPTASMVTDPQRSAVSDAGVISQALNVDNLIADNAEEVIEEAPPPPMPSKADKAKAIEEVEDGEEEPMMK